MMKEMSLQINLNVSACIRPCYSFRRKRKLRKNLGRVGKKERAKKETKGRKKRNEGERKARKKEKNEKT